MEHVEEKRRAKNYMVFVSIAALALGAIGGFIQRDNPFQGCVLVIVALVMIAFFAVKYVSDTPKYDSNESITAYWKKIRKNK
jgi:hypothetical protein